MFGILNLVLGFQVWVAAARQKVMQINPKA